VAGKNAGMRCGKCSTPNGAKANFCAECGSSLASVKAAAALRSAGYYDDPSPEGREVIYKSVSSGVLTETGAAHIWAAEADAIRGYLDSPDPTTRLAAQSALAERGLFT
jgi:hypothetical protein